MCLIIYDNLTQCVSCTLSILLSRFMVNRIKEKVCVWMCARLYVCACVCVRVRVSVHVCVCVCVCVRRQGGVLSGLSVYKCVCVCVCVSVCVCFGGFKELCLRCLLREMCQESLFGSKH